MLQYILVVEPTSKFYTLSTVLFHKYGGDNFVVKNFMSQFSMFVPTKYTAKLANGNTGHAQGIGIIFIAFLNVQFYIQRDQFIIFQVTLTTLSHQVPQNFMLVLKKLHLKLLNIVTLLTLKVVLGYHHNRIKKA